MPWEADFATAFFRKRSGKAVAFYYFKCLDIKKAWSRDAPVLCAGFIPCTEQVNAVQFRSVDAQAFRWQTVGGYMKKAIITVVGKDTVGIIAKVCTFLSEKNINILDISQTITGGFFNMMMIVDVSNSTESFDTVAAEIAQYGKDQIGVDIKMQLEEIFTMMHRI